MHQHTQLILDALWYPQGTNEGGKEKGRERMKEEDKEKVEKRRKLGTDEVR